MPDSIFVLRKSNINFDHTSYDTEIANINIIQFTQSQSGIFVISPWSLNMNNDFHFHGIFNN